MANHVNIRKWVEYDEGLTYRCGNVILMSPMTEVDPVGKWGDHIQGKSIEKTERHLEMGTAYNCTAMKLLDSISCLAFPTLASP